MTQELITVEQLAKEFDKQRHCGWNYDNIPSDYISPELCAKDVPQYASLGGQCWGTLRELALLHTLRPCKECGGDHLYKSAYQIACCSCFSEDGGCEDCHDHDGGQCNTAENMNLPDAITRWNLWYGDNGERGRVTVIG